MNCMTTPRVRNMQCLYEHNKLATSRIGEECNSSRTFFRQSMNVDLIVDTKKFA